MMTKAKELAKCENNEAYACLLKSDLPKIIKNLSVSVSMSNYDIPLVATVL